MIDIYKTKIEYFNFQDLKLIKQIPYKNMVTLTNHRKLKDFPKPSMFKKGGTPVGNRYLYSKKDVMNILKWYLLYK